MDITDMHTVTPDEASYEVTKALLPFLIEAGTPVCIHRDGWALAVSSSIGGPPMEATKEYHEEDWRSLTDAMMTYAHASGKKCIHNHHSRARARNMVGNYRAQSLKAGKS